MNRVHARLAVILGLLLLCSACSDSPAVSSAAPSEAATAAAEGIVLLDGSTLLRSEMAGRWVFVNYWAEWCAPCREEIPELNALQDEAGDRVLVLGVNFDQLPPEVMGPQAEKLGIQFAVAAEDPRDWFGIALPEVLPSTYVFDPEGRQVGVLLGPQDLDQLRAAMQEG